LCCFSYPYLPNPGKKVKRNSVPGPPVEILVKEVRNPGRRLSLLPGEKRQILSVTLFFQILFGNKSQCGGIQVFTGKTGDEIERKRAQTESVLAQD
jgi:hypothetical protein